MAQDSIKTIWRKNNIFDTNVDGHTITVDLAKEAGGDNAGPRPKKLVLVAAAGCTGMDVISLLRKMRVELRVSIFKSKQK